MTGFGGGDLKLVKLVSLVFGMFVASLGYWEGLLMAILDLESLIGIGTGIGFFD